MSVLTIGLSRSVGPAAAEARYVLRTLLRQAGFASDIHWADSAAPPAPSASAEQAWDLFYGPASEQGRARVRIDADPALTGDAEPAAFAEQDGLGFLHFARDNAAPLERGEGVRFRNDIVRACYWLLSGAAERALPKDRHGSATLGSSVLQRVLSRPLVSEYAAFLRRTFADRGPAPLPWSGSGAAFAFSHDVDYPQMIRWIEAPRLAFKGGGLRGVAGVLGGSNHFWRFDDWIDFERGFGARPAFYFSARRGSLWQYARGTPDCFYDVRSAPFRELFARLRETGCEIGLHASYHSFRSVEQLRAERDLLAEASGSEIVGNRHHYFRLDPHAPHETLARHEAIGLQYDSSLTFAYYPGFRRGVCHPFHVFHPDERRELAPLELPVAWMDDHFDRCLAINGITDADTAARALLGAVRRTAGIAVVDYHVRGMNGDFFPRYGPWLRRFAQEELGNGWQFATPREVAERYRTYEESLERASRDATAGGSSGPVLRAAAPAPVAVGPLQPHEESGWEAFVERHADATVYHSLAWRDVSVDGLGHQPRYLRALDGAGNVAGVLPLFEVTGLGGRVLVSVPLRDKGGPLADAPETAQALLAAAAELARERRARSVVIKGPAEVAAGPLARSGFAEERHWVTTVVPLGMGEEALWNEVFRSPTRRAVNKARNSGLEPRWSTDAADLDRFYEVFLMTRRALGVPAYPRRFFRAMWRHLQPRGAMRLLLVERAGTVAGGLIVFPYRREVVSAYMGSDPRARDARVNDLLFWEAIRWSAAAGYASYYFGADSPHQEGLLQYKRKWGGEQFVLPNYFLVTNGSAPRSADSSSPQYARVRRVVSHLPLPLFRALGSILTRRLW